MKTMKKTSIMTILITMMRMMGTSKIRKSMMKILNQLKIKNGWMIKKNRGQIVKVREI